MSPDAMLNLAKKYFVDDLGGSHLSGSFLGRVLQQLEAKKTLSYSICEHLKKKQFNALYDYSLAFTSFETYTILAKKEQQQRITSNSNKSKITKADFSVRWKAHNLSICSPTKKTNQYVVNNKQQIIVSSFPKTEKDPKYIKQQEARNLKDKFGIYFYVEPCNYKKLINILEILEQKKRLTDAQRAWLYKTKDGDYRTDEVERAYHGNEARYFSQEFKKNKNIWDAINACSHYRKADIPVLAESLMKDIDKSKIKQKKEQSACYTTHGGAKRDLRKYDIAIDFGLKAHELTPKDFRPCTLIGAVNMETGNFNEGHAWYEKAIERGFNPNARDQELEKIYLNMKGQEQKAFASFLKNSYGHFKWLKKEHR